MLQNTVT